MIAFILLLLFLISLFILFILGMVNPKKVLKWDKKPSRLKVFIYWVVLTPIIFAVFGLLGVFTSDEYKEKKALEKVTEENKKIEKEKQKAIERNKIKAITYAQVCVEQKLKAPATAEFNLLETNVWQLNDSTFMVKGTVDAQNSFGALLRSYYECKVIFTDEDHFICSDVSLYQ